MSDEYTEDILKKIKDVRLENYEYMESHPEIRALIHEIMQQLLQSKPKDPRTFLKIMFTNNSKSKLQEKVEKHMELFECLHRDKSNDVTLHPTYCFLPSDKDLINEDVCKEALLQQQKSQDDENYSGKSTPVLPPCFPFHTRH